MEAVTKTQEQALRRLARKSGLRVSKKSNDYGNEHFHFVDMYANYVVFGAGCTGHLLTFQEAWDYALDCQNEGQARAYAEEMSGTFKVKAEVLFQQTLDELEKDKDFKKAKRQIWKRYN